MLAVVEVKQLPFLLLLKLHVHKTCAGAAVVVVVVRHRVPDDAICCFGFLNLIPVFLFLYSNTIYMNVSLGRAVACTAPICL